uniref:Kinetochore protein NDC80 n=1 Tax=Ciona intestinalis TaxID=7719 RepID=H2Y2U8_CIOIN|nr:kinetochore protein NDC80 homolog [Ciona intestinalis]|eukprot:XP_002120301.1 kinetochore protein NDC80 homolog [Ciona intestinalis]
MNRPQRKLSVSGRPSYQGGSGQSSLKRSSAATPLMRSSLKRQPLSAVKGNQRSSYVNTDHQIIKDTRPLSDKSYMKKCVFDLIHLLNDLHYPTSLSPKMLNPPTNREYQRIFEFLAITLAGNFRIIKPDEDMMRFVKACGYPYSLSKSTLNNVGPMSSWPHALGVLMWLANQIKIAPDLWTEEEMLEPKQHVQQQFFHSVYNEFMSGNDGPFTETENEARRMLGEINKDTLSEVQSLETKFENLSATALKNEEEKASNIKLFEQISTKRQNIEKMEKYFDDIDKYNSDKQARTLEFNELTASKDEEGNDLRLKILDLETEVAGQEMSKDDVYQHKVKNEQLKGSVISTAERIETLKKTGWELEIETAKALTAMNDRVNVQNNSMQKLWSAVARRLELNEAVKPPALLSGALGFEGNRSKQIDSVQPFMMDLNERLLAHQRKLNQELNDATNRRLQEREMIQDVQKSINILETAADQVHAEIQNFEEERTKKVGTLRSETDKEKTKKCQFIAMNTESVEELEKQVELLQNENLKQGKSFSKQKEDAITEIKELVAQLKEFKIKCNEEIEKFYENIIQQNKNFADNMNEVARSLPTVD